MSIYKGDTLIAGSGTNIVTIYDKNSADSSINWGYTSGIKAGVKIGSKDFSPYKYLIVSAVMRYVSMTYIVQLSQQASTPVATGYPYSGGGCSPMDVASDTFYDGACVNTAKTEFYHYIAVIEYGSSKSGTTSSDYPITKIEGVK